MPPLEKREHKITLDEAVQMTKRHRAAQKSPLTTRSWAYNKEHMLALLNQKGCVGVRVYMGHDEKGAAHLVSVGVDATGNDMTSGDILQMTMPCPPYCPPNSPLNA